MLIRAFEIQIRREMQIRAALKYASPTAAGFEPDVEDVLFLAEFVARKFRARVVGAEQFVGAEIEPRIATVLADAFGDGADRAWRQERFAGLVVEDGDRQAPGTLPRDAPVGTGFEHALQSGAAPVGDEFQLVLDGIERDRAHCPLSLRERVRVRGFSLGKRFGILRPLHPSPLPKGEGGKRLIHRDEPLLRRAKDRRRFAAPVVRIAVADLFLGEQNIQFLQLLRDLRIPFPHRRAL